MKARFVGKECLRLALLVSGLLALTGCPERTAIWIEPGSTASHLVFRISDVRGGDKPIQVGIFRVDRFDQVSDRYDLYWGYGAVASPSSSMSVSYGVMPIGAEPLIGGPSKAPELEEGCYLAYISGTGQTVFVVDAENRVLELAWPSCRDAYPMDVQP